MSDIDEESSKLFSQDSMQQDDDDEHQRLDNDDIWKVLQMFFQTHGLVSQQIGSYESFVENVIKFVRGHEGTFVVRVKPQYKEEERQEAYLEYLYQFQITRCFMGKKNIHVDKFEEEIFPMIARLRDLTYSRQLKIDLEVTMQQRNKRDGTIEEKSKQQFKGLPFFKLPIMVRSRFCSLQKDPKDAELIQLRIQNGECGFDQGGYFILRGSEKVIVAQERIANNVVLVFKSKIVNKPWVAEIRSQPDLFSNPNVFKVELRYIQNTPVIRCSVKQFNSTQGIPLFTLFRALGISSDQEILERIVYNLEDEFMGPMLEMLYGSLQEGGEYEDEELCLRWIGNKIKKAENQDPETLIQEAKKLINKNILPHIGVSTESRDRKAYFLGYIVHRLLNASLGKTDQDDRDHYGKKRLDMAGAMMMGVFKTSFEQFKQNSKKALEKYINGGRRGRGQQTKIENMRQPDDIKSFFDGEQISKDIDNALATGNWGRSKEGQVVKTGVAQTLKRETSLFATLSHLRRMNAPINPQMKLSKPRQLHNTHFGFICPAETPEGQKIGIVKNLSLMTTVSNDLQSKDKETLLKLIMVSQQNDFDFILLQGDFQAQDIPRMTKVLVDGNWIGFTRNPEQFIHEFKNLRSAEESYIPIEVSINFDYVNKEIRIYTDAGRCMRPLFIVQNNKLKLMKGVLNQINDWEELLKNKCVELLDVEEEEGSLIAMDIDIMMRGTQNFKRYTHCEIHPCMMFGVCASVIPFANHNQGPRNTLQSAMGKQAMGLNSTNFNIRFDTLVHILHYPQKPLASSRAVDFITVNEVPIGINCVTSIACFTGYNQEDSIIINQYAIDRGFFRSVFYRTYKESEDKDPDNFTETKITKPIGDNFAGKLFIKLDSDGIVPPGTKVDEEEPIIGKELIIDNIMLNTANGQKNTKECSLLTRRAERGVVDSVLISENQKGYKLVKVKVRSLRIPQIGDKFCSRHGQKGTCGMTYRQEDLPYTLVGISPDLTINPHCIPSRMTIGHLIECLSSKLASIKGQFNDATPFAQILVNDIANELHKVGWQKWGNEVMTNPYTGNMFSIPIFVGPTYYQRLRHLVDDKMYARSRGPVTGITRQPTHGRSRKGGLRFGEMERDCIISHGTAKFLKERTYDVSDAFRVHVCSKCGMFAVANLENQEFYCNLCKNQNNQNKIYQVQMPYAAKTLIQELISMNIAPRLKFDQSKMKHEI
ncbi:unnamed protein product (macronuclear) [Paramecium tetraurelia]|uniref:DNA-directed RNA polymerase subunit beta n=1 Tax=Paramecium tetraurelia TaxID=5888 RepID=A0CUT2_PARTE|nr:uncharacterized protein GSPATT00010750001 [Paramecium tetraurelia]CAK74549.1 unnamed protein product [Paramecium tetraurelia]|eukprot:XP_001441946.1 hypothetical protein (macronuclear) [Paramecium tetraurelia strain d4-2]